MYYFDRFISAFSDDPVVSSVRWLFDLLLWHIDRFTFTFSNTDINILHFSVTSLA